MQKQLSGLLVQEEAGAGRGRMVDLPGGVDSAQRGGHVRYDTSHANPVGLLGDGLKAESLLDSFLRALCQPLTRMPESFA